MRVFVTGATGFIGSPLVKELIGRGHQVRGLARNDAAAAHLTAMGAEVHRGDLTDPDSLHTGAQGMEAVVNLAFNHDFSTFAENARDEMRAIETLGEALEPGKLLVVTAGLLRGTPGHVRTESDPPAESAAVPRRPEQTAQAVAARGVHVAVVRLGQIHDAEKQGMVTYLAQTARRKGASAYVGDGTNRWSAAPVMDVKNLYRLVIERASSGLSTYHAVQEEGVSLRDMAQAIGKGLGIPVVSIPAAKAVEHFGPFLGQIAALDLPASSEWTRKTLGWEPTGPGLIEDLTNGKY